MPRITLILSDCYPSPVDQQARVGLPRLAALEFCLARADRSRVATGWQQWLALQQGGLSLAAQALGGMAAAGFLGLTDERHYWLATPVHYVAGIDNLRLHPAGLLRLPASEQRQLAQDFAAVFAGSGWELIATGQRDLLLAGPAQSATGNIDPARLLGRDPTTATPAGSAGAALRRLSSECEMWLHEHAVNRVRDAARQLRVSGLWLWGGGPPAMALPGRNAELLADDLFVGALARLTGATAAPLPNAWSGFVPHGAGDEVAVVCPVAGDSAVAELQRIERDWLAPMLSEWRAGRWTGLTVVAGDQVAILERASRWRWWRTARPWWESLSAC